MSKPRIAITMGDAAGVGPEIIMKALAHADLYDRCRPLVVGDAARLGQAGLELYLFDAWRPRAVQAYFHDVWMPQELQRLSMRRSQP